MAIKKNELYSSLWASCDNLRGGTDRYWSWVTDKIRLPITEETPERAQHAN